MKRKVILTCAVSGNAPFNPKHPCFPVTPMQIADATIEAARAGASICHIHARDPQTTGGTRDPALYREIVDRVRSSGTDIVINLTCGHGGFFLPDPADEGRNLPEGDVATPAERVRHLEECLPEIASLDISTGNQVEGKTEFVYLNTTRSMRTMAARFRELGIKPELETFQAGDILFGRKMIEEGLVEDPPLFQIVLGVQWAAPADTESMLYMRSLLPAGAQWAAFGIGRRQMPMVAQAVLLGGNVRVGLEDNLYLDRGVFATNGQLVERARAIVENLGEGIATPAEARTLLNLHNFG
jgi:uncharacterized protein (DUF849 family)